MKPTLPPIDPTKHTVVPPEPELSRKAAQNIVRVFVCLLALPLVFEVAAWFTPTKTNLAAATVRSGMQWLLTHALTEGNHAVFLGRDGWLFDQREIDRVVHAQRESNGLHAGLLKLAAQLKAQEIPLIVIVMPGRAALYPEQIRPGRYAGPVRVQGETEALAELKVAGAEVLDMTAALWENRDKPQVYFAQDSHWTPAAMKVVALVVNKRVREKFPRLGSTETPIINATILEHADAGDLARQLDPLFPANLLGEETADLISIQGIEADAKSPIVLHGGELLRVFDDAGLSFGGGGAPSHAGFGTQLGTLMGRPLDVRGMPQPGQPYADKKLVICLLPMTELAP